MKFLRRPAALLAAVMILSAASASCSGKGSGRSTDTSSDIAETTSAGESELSSEAAVSSPKLPEDMTITWLADYDLNSADSRTAALALFEDVYGGEIKYVYAAPGEKLAVLESTILSGGEADMFPFEPELFPDGVLRQQFEPLDPYFDIMGFDEGLWDDMQNVIDALEYDGQHYVVPYAVSDPFVLTYNRNVIKEAGLDDPYELYKAGKWDWNAFTDMLESFREYSGGTGYGINGWFGQAALQSTGHAAVKYENGRLANNISDPEIESAELLMQDIASKGLYSSTWLDHFPTDGSSLFYAMGDWALGISNARNPEADLMVVPFPKSPKADEHYIPCAYNARMLVKNSKKGGAVAAYLKCERLAAAENKYKEAEKEKTLTVVTTSSGTVRSFVTEEQYDAIQDFKAQAAAAAFFDFGYGMGEKMNSEGLYTFDTRGVMNNLTSALLDSSAPVDSWEALRDLLSPAITDEVNRYNAG